MDNLDAEFNNIIESLFDTQDDIFNNAYEKEKIQRFKELCKTRKLVLVGTGYYAKSIAKYLKLKYQVEVYGAYDYIEEEIEKKDGPFYRLSDLKHVDMKKYNKGKDKLNLIPKEEFYKNPEDYVVFMNMDIYTYSVHSLYWNQFKYIYSMRSLAKDVMSVDMLNKSTVGFEEYDLNKLNHKFSQIEIANIRTLYDLLEDEKSKKVFMNVLKFKLTEDFHYTISVRDKVSLQYFDKEVISFSDDEVFIDCGAYIGDSVEAFLKATNGKFKHIYSYEPDPKNFKRLKENVAKLEQKDSITPINAGVSYKNQTFYLSGEEMMTTCTKTVTENKAQVVAIDETINHIPTFIKMDVQSFEASALLGVKNSIIKHKPKLAISIYHKFDDLWTLPLLLKLWVPEYKLIIRHYEFNQEETILYAMI